MEEPKVDGCGCLMAMLLLIVVLVSILVLDSCSPRVVERIVTRDSTIVEIRDRIVHDTAVFEIPKEVEKIVTRDTSSRLENAYAISDAVVSGGYLMHSLETKPQQIAVPVDVAVADTTTTHTSTTDHEYPTTVEVEMPLTGWQRFRLSAFWWLIGGIALEALLIMLISKRR